MTRRRTRFLAFPVALVLAAGMSAAVARPAAALPLSAPVSGTAVCGQAILNSPYGYTGAAGSYTSGTAGLPTFGSAGTDFPAATAGLVVAPGDNSAAAGSGAYQLDNTVVYFEPGVHTITSGMYTGTGTVYIGGFTAGAGAAILDGGGHAGLDGSDSQNANETWKYLTVRNFGSDRDKTVLGNVNGAAFSSGNTYQYDTIGPNEYNGSGGSGQNNGGGFGVSFYSNTTIDHSCLTQDAQGAFNGSSGINNKITNNEISKGGLGEYPDDPANPNSCGCAAGGKVLDNLNTDITGNWVHDNYNAGIWADFDNSGLDISGNYISGNWGSGITVEASYNTQISNNTLAGNGWPSNGAFPSTPFTCFGGIPCTQGLGPVTGGGGGNPFGAIELDNSGGDANLSSVAIPNGVPVQGCSSNCSVTSRFSGQFLVQGNVLTDNFGGVKAYTDTDRYPGNVDNDSACSVILGTGATGQQPNSPVYYQQTRTLQTATSDSSVSGSAVTSTGGTVTLCDNYGGTQQDAGPGGAAQAPSVGMAVFDMDHGTFLGNVASVTSNKSFTLDRSPGNVTGVRLYSSAYGGCAMADEFGGAPGVASGNPSANYWDHCIWGSRNETVSGNTFTLNSGTVANCTSANMCGYMGTQAFLAGVPQLMQVFQAGYRDKIGNASGGLGNVWSGNAYAWTGSGGSGAWQFENGSQVTAVTQAQWQNTFGQDAGSTGLTGGGGGQAPVVVTQAASNVASTSATLNGTVNPEGAATTYQFEYGTTTAYGSVSPASPGSAGSGISAVPEAANITGLTATTTYHYRLNATNVTGTTHGSDQTFATTSGGGGTVTYDATGPGAGGQKCANCSSLNWNHTVSGSNTALVVGVAVGQNNDGGLTASATYNGVAMTLLKQVHDNNQPDGYLDVFGLTAPASGTHSVSVSVSGGSATELTGGSESFDGAAQAGTFGTPASAYGFTATPAVTAGSSASDMIAGFAASGSSISSATSPSTSRYIANQDGNTGAGNSAGATSPSTGSNVTMAWPGANDYWGAIAVQVNHS